MLPGRHDFISTNGSSMLQRKLPRPASPAPGMDLLRSTDIVRTLQPRRVLVTPSSPEVLANPTIQRTVKRRTKKRTKTRCA